jgi:endonuclease/exonuclease/phosphatase family metal-dependent hydrolase
MQLSVITYNIRYGKHLEKITKWLSVQPAFDILCFQEFPLHKANFLLKSLKKATYQYTFACGFLRHKKEYGQLTVFNTETVIQKDSTIVLLGKLGFIERKIFKNAGERSALVTTFLCQGKKFALVNTHLIWFALNRSRKKELHKITDALSHIIPSPTMPTILLGDFNYSSLTRKKGLVEFMKQFNFHDGIGKLHTHKLFMFTSIVKHQIDYVFVRKCSVNKATMTKINYSDHYPVHFTLEL